MQSHAKRFNNERQQEDQKQPQFVTNSHLASLRVSRISTNAHTRSHHNVIYYNHPLQEIFANEAAFETNSLCLLSTNTDYKQQLDTVSGNCHCCLTVPMRPTNTGSETNQEDTWSSEKTPSKTARRERLDYSTMLCDGSRAPSVFCLCWWVARRQIDVVAHERLQRRPSDWVGGKKFNDDLSGELEKVVLLLRPLRPALHFALLLACFSDCRCSRFLHTAGH